MTGAAPSCLGRLGASLPCPCCPSCQATGRDKKALLRVVGAMSRSFLALSAYPLEALVALCESVQTDEGDARCAAPTGQQ